MYCQSSEHPTATFQIFSMVWMIGVLYNYIQDIKLKNTTAHKHNITKKNIQNTQIQYTHFRDKLTNLHLELPNISCVQKIVIVSSQKFQYFPICLNF